LTTASKEAVVVEATFRNAYAIALRAARARAVSAVASGAIAVADREDLEQEAVVACFRALPRFDPSRASLRTFIERVVATRLATVIRRTRRNSPSVPVDTLSQLPVIGDDGQREVRMSIDGVLESLHEEDRELVGLLLEVSPAEASRELGIPRSTVHDRILQLRQRFAQAGLDIRARRPGRGAGTTGGAR
jgi:RNA polymerase sigma factor (sigma-70 family)